ncbi:MAG: hypothetical protein Q7T05_08265 [Dehalococcoidia bacterium]|nr:hypothetical protein [Dehalococcoidia bacterium]
MSADAKLCGVCGTNEASRACTECDIPICDMCAKEVLFQDVSPGSMVKPGVSTSPLRAGSKKKRVCPNCLESADFM